MTEPTGPRPRPTTADPAQTVFFGIPLKARATAKNWDWTVRDINRTLASIYNQTNPNFRILVGCHDVPDLLIPTDERLEFIQVDSTTPDLNKDPRSNFPDKELKLRRVSNRFRELGGRWFMPLDADDLVSSQLVQFVLSNPNPNGFIARHGYIFNQESWMMALVPQPKIYPASFDRLAGCTIFRFEEEDFLAANQFGPQSRFDRYISSQDHREFWQMSLQENRPLHPLPFPAFVYVLNTGDNHTFLYGAHRNWLNQELLPKLNAHGSLPNPEVTQEFALSHSVWNRSSSALFKGRHPNEPGFRAAFIGYAGMKCGSTALWEHLKLHPQIGLARFKEMRYFNDDQNFTDSHLDYSGYHAHFERNENVLIYGEATPLYAYHPSALHRIRDYNPECKILCIFRNPMERAYSHWCMEVREGREDKSFAEALRLEDARHRSGLRRPLERSYDFSYIGCGLYTAQIREIWKVFPPQQTLFLKTDDLRRDPKETMSKVFRFLGVEPIDVPHNLSARVGGYKTRPTAQEREILYNIFEFEIRALERMLDWDCSSWTTE